MLSSVGNEGLQIPDRNHGCKYNPMHFVHVFFVYNKDWNKFLLCCKQKILMKIYQDCEWCGQWGIRTPDPLGVNQVLWTNWANCPSMNKFIQAGANIKGFLNLTKKKRGLFWFVFNAMKLSLLQFYELNIFLRLLHNLLVYQCL